MSKIQPAQQQKTETIARIVAAARECFGRDGVERTWMATVAAEVGMARQTLYTFVPGRKPLLELALAARCRELMGGFREHLGSGPWDVREELVELMALMIETCRADAEFTALAGAMKRDQAFHVLAGPSRLRPLVVEVFRPLLEQARADGILRPGADDEEIVGWMQTIMTPLTGRSDLDAVHLRRLLAHFAVPAVVVDGTAAQE